jgi:hypothetical protein
MRGQSQKYQNLLHKPGNEIKKIEGHGQSDTRTAEWRNILANNGNVYDTAKFILKRDANI